MKWTCMFSAAVLAWVSVLGPAVAQESTPPSPLSLQDCINVAMQNQVDILTAQGNVSIAKNRVIQAKSDYYPQISAQNNAFTLGSKGVLNRTTNGTAINVTENIFDAGVREANVRGARYDVSQNTAGLSRTTQTVAYQVAQSYYDLLRSKHLMQVAAENVKYNEGLRDQIKARAESGDAAQTDVLPVESQLASARVNLLSAQNNVRISAISLQSAMGLSPQPGFDVQEITAEPQMELQPLDAYVSAATAGRPDILQRRAAVGSAKANVRVAGAYLYPRPVITGQYQHSISGGFSTDSTQIVGGIVFDVFDGGANRAAYNAAKADRVIAEQQAQQVMKDVRAQVEQAYLNLTSSKERVSAADVGLTAAQRNYDVQQERYNQGLGITLDLLNAEVQLVTAQSDAVQAKYDYYTAVAQMDYATGRQGGSDAR